MKLSEVEVLCFSTTPKISWFVKGVWWCRGHWLNGQISLNRHRWHRSSPVPPNLGNTSRHWSYVRPDFTSLLLSLIQSSAPRSPDLPPCDLRSVPLQSHKDPLRPLLPIPSSSPLLPRPPLPAVHPCRLLNSAPLTEEQTNETPRGNEAASGNRRSEWSPAYWCGIDHYWEERRRKEGKRRRYGERSCDLMEWIELSAAAGVKKKKKVTRQKPWSLTRAMR